ncbi:MAG: nitroreductase family deazaflavin-dependent oxidoreductase, partial [Chloroflexi bacterium]|nr:nitroreductase family deazaflavin-dependent oxidoreductase [Chloroflexota bacterium]
MTLAGRMARESDVRRLNDPGATSGSIGPPVRRSNGAQERQEPPTSSPAMPPLPYGPIMRRLIRPLQRGFLVLNRWFMGPAIRAGLGPLIGNPVTGHIMLLRTRGRRSGLVREAPLGYVIRDGSVYCVAGYGAATPWVRNLEADPSVEVVLPTRTLKGRAAIVTDDGEWLGAYRALIRSFGLLGRCIVEGDPTTLDDATVLATHRSLPVVRIRPAGT